MEIKYEITPDDLFYYSKEASKGTSLYTYSAVFMTVVVVLFMLADVLMAVLAAIKNDGSIKVDAANILPRCIAALIISGIYYVAMMTLSKGLFRRSAKNATGKNGLFCKHTIMLATDGFTETTHVNKTFISWEGVEDIKETASYLIIGPRLGARYFIPKRAFSGPDNIRSFVETAQKYIDDANVPPSQSSTD